MSDLLLKHVNDKILFMANGVFYKSAHVAPGILAEPWKIQLEEEQEHEKDDIL